MFWIVVLILLESVTFCNAGTPLDMTVTTPIINQTIIERRFAQLTVLVDPPDGAMSPSALGVFARANSETATIYYTLDGSSPTLQSDSLAYTGPYIHIDTPFLAPRNRILTLIAVDYDILADKYYKSEQRVFNYSVEATARPNRYITFCTAQTYAD